MYACILDMMGTISLFAISLGEAAAASRIMYAQTRDATGKRAGLARLGSKGQPVVALSVVLLVFFCALVGRQLAGSSVVNATFYPLQIGTVLILVAYVLATIGAVYYLFFRGEALAPRWQMVVPLLGGAFVCYTIYRNVFVGQVGTYHHLPYIELIWLVIGLVVVVTAPGLAGRVKRGLASGTFESAAPAPVTDPAA